MSCSRETCFSAFSWSRAPTKSRLMSSLPPLRHDRIAAEKKRGGHPRPRRPFMLGGVYNEIGRARNGRRCGAAQARRASGRDGGSVAPFDVALEDVDELVDQPLAAQGPVEPAVDE